MWIFLVLIYGLLKGARDIIKKLALKYNSVIEVLLVYTFLAFLLVIPTASDALDINTRILLPVALKSLFVFSAWIFSFKAIRKLPVSIVGILDLSRVLFATFLGVTVLKEVMGFNQIIGLILVCVGLLSLKLFTSSKNSKSEDIKIIYILMVFASCILNALSGLMDKLLLGPKLLTSSQLQFWYMGFMLVYYIIYAYISKEKISKSSFKNIWIWLLAILFVIADKALFIANADPNSKVTIMTLIKQSGSLVTIIGGYIVFKEKNIIKKLICALIIVLGIFISNI